MFNKLLTVTLVPNSVTLNDPEWCNNPQVCIISPNSVAFGVHYVKVVEDTLILSAQIVSKPFCFRIVKEEICIRQTSLLTNKSVRVDSNSANLL